MSMLKISFADLGNSLAARLAPFQLRDARPFSSHRAALTAIALLFSSTASAQDPNGTPELEALIQRVEALAKTVETQAARIEEQEAEIEALKAAQSLTAASKDNDSPVFAVMEDDETVAVLEAPKTAETQARQASTPHAEDPQIGRFPDTAIVRPGDFDGSITIPGDSGSFRIGGFVRAQLNYDIDNIGSQDGAVPYTVPLDGFPEDGTQQLGFSVRDTQVNFDYRRDTDLGLFRTFIEFDFFGDGDEVDGSFGVRLRHAALGIGNLQVGQFWSLFTDLNATPEVADLLGPHGAPILRTPGVRWYDKIGDNWNWAIGIENPAGDITADASELASESIPNIVGYLERTGDWGHVRISGVGQELRAASDKTFTGGASLTGRINIPYLSKRGAILFGGQVGAGFAQQYAGFGGVGLDGVVDENGVLDATEILAGFVGYQHWWAELWRSTVYVSMFDFDAGEAAPADTLSRSFKTAGNLFWTPVRNANVGAEIIYITRETLAEEEGDGVRVQAVAQFNF